MEFHFFEKEKQKMDRGRQRAWANTTSTNPNDLETKADTHALSLY